LLDGALVGADYDSVGDILLGSMLLSVLLLATRLVAITDEGTKGLNEKPAIRGRLSERTVLKRGVCSRCERFLMF